MDALSDCAAERRTVYVDARLASRVVVTELQRRCATRRMAEDTGMLQIETPRELTRRVLPV